MQGGNSPGQDTLLSQNYSHTHSYSLWLGEFRHAIYSHAHHRYQLEVNFFSPHHYYNKIMLNKTLFEDLLYLKCALGYGATCVMSGSQGTWAKSRATWGATVCLSLLQFSYLTPQRIDVQIVLQNFHSLEVSREFLLQVYLENAGFNRWNQLLSLQDFSETLEYRRF